MTNRTQNGIPAKYPGTCVISGARYEPGTMISRFPNGEWQIVGATAPLCAECGRATRPSLPGWCEPCERMRFLRDDSAPVMVFR